MENTQEYKPITREEWSKIGQGYLDDDLPGLLVDEAWRHIRAAQEAAKNEFNHAEKFIQKAESELQSLRKENKRLRLEKEIAELRIHLFGLNEDINDEQESVDYWARTNGYDSDEYLAARSRLNEGEENARKLNAEITSLETQLKENG